MTVTRMQRQLFSEALTRAAWHSQSGKPHASKGVGRSFRVTVNGARAGAKTMAMPDPSSAQTQQLIILNDDGSKPISNRIPK